MGECDAHKPLPLLAKETKTAYWKAESEALCSSFVRKIHHILCACPSEKCKCEIDLTFSLFRWNLILNLDNAQIFLNSVEDVRKSNAVSTNICYISKGLADEGVRMITTCGSGS